MSLVKPNAFNLCKISPLPPPISVGKKRNKKWKQKVNKWTKKNKNKEKMIIFTIDLHEVKPNQIRVLCQTKHAKTMSFTTLSLEFNDDSMLKEKNQWWEKDPSHKKTQKQLDTVHSTVSTRLFNLSNILFKHTYHKIWVLRKGEMFFV